jgi:hypothetical protein
MKESEHYPINFELTTKQFIYHFLNNLSITYLFRDNPKIFLRSHDEEPPQKLVYRFFCSHPRGGDRQSSTPRGIAPIGIG